MSTNRHKRPARPQVELMVAAEPREAAAVVAAVERYLADTAVPPALAASVNPWQQAALLEGFNRTRGSPPREAS